MKKSKHIWRLSQWASTYHHICYVLLGAGGPGRSKTMPAVTLGLQQFLIVIFLCDCNPPMIGATLPTEQPQTLYCTFLFHKPYINDAKSGGALTIAILCRPWSYLHQFIDGASAKGHCSCACSVRGAKRGWEIFFYLLIFNKSILFKKQQQQQFSCSLQKQRPRPGKKKENGKKGCCPVSLTSFVGLKIKVSLREQIEEDAFWNGNFENNVQF